MEDGGQISRYVYDHGRGQCQVCVCCVCVDVWMWVVCTVSANSGIRILIKLTGREKFQQFQVCCGG